MGRAFYPLAGNAVERFGETLSVPSQDLHYTIFEKDGRYFMRQFQHNTAGAEINADTRELTFVIGSGNHSRSYVVLEGDRMYQAPVCWYPEPQRWDLCPGYEIRNEYFSREVDDTCVFCHNGRVAWAGDFSNRFREPPPHGIDCERCHGPGSLHVEKWSSASASEGGASERPGDQRADAADATILNPAKLPPDRAMQVCMQCHLGDAAQTERVLRRKDHLTAYRPGQQLQEYLSVHVYESKLHGQFGLGAQADRLVLSRCHIASKGTLQCITCHDPHQEVYEVSAADPGHFDRACATCHAARDCPDPASAGGTGCVGCHMSRAEPHDQRFTTFTDHWIRRDPRSEPARARDDFRMVPFFADSSEHESAAEAALYRGRACFNKKTGSLDGAAMPWDLCVDALQEAARLDPGLAPAHFFLGKVWMARGRAAEAEPHFREALRADPAYADAMQELGSSLLAQGEFAEARGMLEKALASGVRADDRAAVLIELGRVGLGSGDRSAALDWFAQALRVEPLSPEAHANLGLLSLMEKSTPAAVGHFNAALRLAPNEPWINRMLAMALIEEGHHQDLAAARQAADRAARLNPSDRAAWEALSRACDGLRDRACAEQARQKLRQLKAGAAASGQ